MRKPLFGVNIQVFNGPGSDGALAAGVLKVIIDEELYDRDVVDHWTVGFDRMKEEVSHFTLDDVETGDPDLKVVIEPSDPSSLAAANGVTKLVSAGEVDAARAQAQLAQQRAVTAVE